MKKKIIVSLIFIKGRKDGIVAGVFPFKESWWKNPCSQYL